MNGQALDGKITVAATGDSMITRRVSIHKEVGRVVEVLKKADVRYTNCEMLFHRCESYPAAKSVAPEGTRMYAEPFIAGELRWMGFNLTSLCNNHTMDYGPVGMFSSMKALEDNSIVHAGSGKDLGEAREPRYLDTENGRVALIAACWSDFQEASERASNMKAGVLARPGINLFHVNTIHTVNEEQFRTLSELVSALGLNPPRGRPKHPAGELVFLRHHFRLGDKVGTVKHIRKQDVDDTIKTIQDAKKAADWVFVSFHTHDSDARGAEYPPEFVVEFARTCIDAGADAFLGTGTHVLQGIQIYKRKPIFYGLGCFIVQELLVKKVTFDQYDHYGLSGDAKPSELYQARAGSIPPSVMPYARWWFESVIPLFELNKEGLTQLELTPITLGFENSLTRRGYPQIATASEGTSILEHVQQISAAWNTKMLIKDNCGRVKID